MSLLVYHQQDPRYPLQIELQIVYHIDYRFSIIDFSEHSIYEHHLNRNII